MKSSRPRASSVVPQGFATETYATSAKEKAIACSSLAAGRRSGQNGSRASGEGRGNPSVNGDGRLFAEHEPAFGSAHVYTDAADRD
jgi:hypothetical protein